jgi:hypothetical protein
MPGQIEARIYRLSGLCAFVVAASLVVPRFVTNAEGGFASGAAAVLTLLFLLAVAFVMSLYVLRVAIQHYRGISPGARVVGIGPSIVLALALLGLVTFLRY